MSIKPSKSKQRADPATAGNAVEKLRNNLISQLRCEFVESTRQDRNFRFDVDFLRPLENVTVRSWCGWSSSKSFVSAGSFNIDRARPTSASHSENHYFSQQGGLTRVLNLEFSLAKAHQQQVRTFKTYRSMISESQRTPTILSRLKEAYNQPSTLKKSPIGSGQSAQSTDVLAKLLNSSETANMTSEQKQQLKVAFAEGYLAANHPEAQKGGKTMKYLKVRIILCFVVVTKNYICDAMQSPSYTCSIFRFYNNSSSPSYLSGSSSASLRRIMARCSGKLSA